ncbi:hypothetical protein RYX36_024048 [Vicia faba]
MKRLAEASKDIKWWTYNRSWFLGLEQSYSDNRGNGCVLDAKSERIVQEALDKMSVNRTTVVVAHRLITIRREDTIALIKNGVVTEKGRHVMLMKIIDESRAIVRYYTEKYADRGPNLLGTTLEEKVIVDQCLEVEAHNFNDLCFNIMFNLVTLPRMGKPGDIGLVHKCEYNLEKVFDVYESRLSKSTYLTGDNFSLADLSHLPRTGHLIEAAKMGHLVSERKNVKAWWEKVSSRPTWKKLKNLVG